MNDLFITLITDDGYAMQTWVTIKSIIESKGNDTSLKIYIIGDCLSEQNKSLLESVELYTSTETNIEIYVIEVNSKVDFKDKVDENTLKGWSPAVLYKFCISDILPKEVKKVIYLDGDMLIRQDLSELYKIDLSHKCLAAVRDVFYDVIYHEKRLDRQGMYFNTGCMLLNLERMRSNNFPKLLIETKMANSELGLADQDTYNVVVRPNEILLLPLKYNFYITNFLVDENIEGFKKYTTCPYSTKKEMIEDIAIIHMIHFRPWKLEKEMINNINKLLGDSDISIMKRSIAYILKMWVSYYEVSPYNNGYNNLIADNEKISLSDKGLKSKNRTFFFPYNVIQEYYEGEIHVSLYLGKLKLITKTRKTETDKIDFLSNK